jgi:hypothetical protein
MALRWTGCLLALALVGCQPPETRFDVTLTPQAADVIKVAGTTSLPDGAQINVSLFQPGAADPVVVDLPVVKAGGFTAVLDPKRDLPAGAYEVRVEFSPRAYAWSDQVKPAVGERGEKLGGPHVQSGEDGIRVLRRVEPVTLP